MQIRLALCPERQPRPVRLRRKLRRSRPTRRRNMPSRSIRPPAAVRHPAAAICARARKRGLFNLAPQCAAAICGAAAYSQSLVVPAISSVRRAARTTADRGGPYPACALTGYAYASAQLSSSLTRSTPATNCASSVFGQEGISGSYMVDAGGNVNLPLVGAVPARGYNHASARQDDRRAAQAGLRAPAACDGRDREPTGRSSSWVR